MTAQTTLINFRMLNSLRDPLDAAVRLSGKTRTHILNDLVQNYVLNEAPKIPQIVAESNRIRELLMNAAA